MLRLIKEIAAASDYSYGTRRIKKAMFERGYRFGRYKARQLRREAGTQVRHRKNTRSLPTAITNNRYLIMC